MTELIDHAVALAASGWPVFPLARRSKVPLVAGGHGHLDGSTDPAEAERRWTKHPYANIGARVPDTLVCVDLDPRNGAVETLGALVGTYGRLPATLTSLTGSGGAHMFYARPAGELTQRSNLLGDGIDVKVGGRGYVVLPPSIHPNGRRYCWAADLTEVAPMPAWMTQKLRPPPARAKRPVSSVNAEGDTFEAIAADYNVRARWADILEPHGWTHWRTRGENQHWTRPGESARTSATINGDGDGVLYVFSTAAGLEDHRGYSKFGAFVILNHGGDYAAAVAALREASCTP